MGLVIDKIKGPLLHQHKPINIGIQTNMPDPGSVVVNLGFLFNWYVVSDVRNISAAGWHVATAAEFSTLITFVKGADADCVNTNSKLKSSDGQYWLIPGSNTTNLGVRGCGVRFEDGAFYYQHEGFYCHSNDIYNSTNRYGLYLSASISIYNDLRIGLPGGSDWDKVRSWGLSLLFIKDSTTLTNGQTGTYTGNNGIVYPTVCIGTQEWLASPLLETKYRDGSLIPEVTDPVSWPLLTTGARCSYNNDSAMSGTFGSTTNVISVSDSVIFKEGANIQLSLEGNTLTIAETAPSDIAGNAGTATKLHTSRNVNSVAFDGSSDITIPESQQTLNLVTAYSVAY